MFPLQYISHPVTTSCALPTVPLGSTLVIPAPQDRTLCTMASSWLKREVGSGEIILPRPMACGPRVAPGTAPKKDPPRQLPHRPRIHT